MPHPCAALPAVNQTANRFAGAAHDGRRGRETGPRQASTTALTQDRGRARIVPVDDAQRRRVAENEATCRRVNEGREKTLWEDEPGSSEAFLCECGRPECRDVVHVTLSDYERVRAHPRRFIVRPRHEEPAVDTVVDAQDDYVVVEKRDEAGRVAEAEDPRG
jgi:hypothetical protein